MGKGKTHRHTLLHNLLWVRSQNCKERLLASSCLCVCLVVCVTDRMEQLVSHWMGFHEM